MRPALTPSRRLLPPSTPLFTLSSRSLSVLPSLSNKLDMLPMLLLPQLLPQLCMVLPLLDLLLLAMLVLLPHLLLELTPSSQLSKLPAPDSDLSGLYNKCAVSDFLRHTSCTVTGRWGPCGCCCLFYYCQVRGSQAKSSYIWLQYAVITYKTSGSSSLLNAFYHVCCRSRRELFIKYICVFFE